MPGRPNLINPSNWQPFPSIPIDTPSFSPPPSPSPSQPLVITRRAWREKNSRWLNFIGLVIIICIGYFLYGIYKERKLRS